MDLLYSDQCFRRYFKFTGKHKNITNMDALQQSSTVQTLLQVLHTIKQNSNEAQVECCMNELAEILDDISVDDLEVLELKDSHSTVLEAMGLYFMNHNIQRQGSFVLSRLVEESEKLKYELVNFQVHRFMARIMVKYDQDVCIQAVGCRLISMLTNCPGIKNDVLSLDVNIVATVVKAMERFESEEEFQLPALQLLIELLDKNNEAQEKFTLKGYHGLVWDILQNHTYSGEILEQGLTLLSMLSHMKHIATQLIDRNILVVTMEIMNNHLDSSGVQSAACSMLGTLARHKDCQQALVKQGVHKAILTALQKHRRRAEVQSKGLEAIGRLTPLLIKYMARKLESNHWMHDILVAMATHGDKPDVLCKACFALFELIDSYPGLCTLIGEEEVQLPLHSAIMAALVLHLDNADLCQSACRAVACVTRHSEVVKKAFLSKGLYLYIIQAMQKHEHVAAVQKWGCQSLRRLCINDVECKELLIKCGVLEQITNCLFRYPDDCDVQEEAIAITACLATDIELVRHQCAAEEVYIRVLEAMTSFLDNVLLVEISLEVLGVLVAAEEIPELLVEAGAISVILNTMDKHAGQVTIQQKSCVLLQVLAGYLKGDVCVAAVTAILKAMCDFPFDEAVQEEGCVALHIISQFESDNSEILVNQCAHERLFAILEVFTSKRKLIELASECLWFLGCKRNLKARMLLSACAGGLLKGAKCLVQIGADVNAGEGTNTPLCAACKNNREDMVRFLLTQGITDVQTALALCLEMEHHNLVGILLQKVGHDREAGVIAWGGLKLGSLCPEWLSPALSGRKYSVPIDGLSWYDYLRDAEQERKRRFTISSDLTDVSSMTGSFTRRSLLERANSLVLNCTLPEDEIDGMITEKESMFEDGLLTKESPLRSGSLSGASLPYSPYDPRVVTPFSQGGAVILPRSSSRSSVEVTSARKVSLQEIPPDDNFNEFPQYCSPPTFNLGRRKSKSMLDISDLGKSTALDNSSVDDGFVSGPDTSTGRHVVGLRRRAVSHLDQIVLPKPPSSFEMPGYTFIYSPDTVPPSRRSRPMSVTEISEEESPVMLEEIKRKEKGVHTSPLRRRRKLGKASLKSNVTARATVRVIDVSGNGINDLQCIATAGEYLLMHLVNVERLDLSNNHLSYFPSSLCDAMPKLEHVNFSHNNFERFPVYLVQCQRLKFLNLSYNNLISLSQPPKSVSSSILLEYLSLAHTSLKNFPEWLADFLPGLTELSVAGNDIVKLPSTVFKVRRLKILDISHNQIETIPDTFISECFSLETLNASCNALCSLPESVAPYLTRLKVVRMAHNNLATKSPFHIPRFFLMLPNLKVVDLSHNKLTHVPSPQTWSTQQLKELMLAHNKIKKVPLENGVDRWTSLERLILSNNNLKSVPKGIGGLKALTSLDLSHNPGISSLPDEMGKLSNLWDLQLVGLRLDLDDSIQGKSKDLIAFLHSKLMNSVPYYRMKLVTLGLGGRGKTTLLNQLLKSKASAPHKELVIRDWVVRDSKASCKFCHHKSVIYTISTWDFKGREDLYHVFQCLMSSRTLYLAVYDVSRGGQEFEALRPWLLNIHACAPDAPVMLVGTHLDRVPKDRLNEVLQMMREKAQNLFSSAGLPEIKAHVVLNCTQETPGIQALRDKIVNLIVKCKCKGHNLLGSRVPQAFVHLQSLVLEEASSPARNVPVLSRGELRRLLQDGDLQMNEGELSQAVKFLHEAGVLVHYDDPVSHLSDFFFIRPEWLCHVISSVVTAGNDVGLVTNGILRRDDLNRLIEVVEVGKSAAKLPPELLSPFLRLLERYGVLLPLNDNEFLMPSRLIPMPSSVTLPDSSLASTCRRLYDMAYVPLGFWSRLITRLLLFTRTMNPDGGTSEKDNGTEELHVQYWSDGMHVHWSTHAYFVVSHDTSRQFGANVLSIVVPNTKSGFRLFGNLVDHVDVLIEEWFPGLGGTDPVQCLPLVKRMCPCIACEDENSHAFTLEECTEQALIEEYIMCPKTSVTMPLQQVAPDVVLADLDSQLLVDEAELALEETKEAILGDGGYGTVYKAKYYGQFVAVKVFHSEGDVNQHRLLRQELPFLSRLRHPSIISMIGVCLRPRALVLELAPLGSLSSLLSKGEGLSRGLQHRIALQVAEGLAFLHRHMIVYRDLKPHNILIFSLSLGILINAKISDYGIARYATLYGLTASEGTPGYRAPEVARGDISYNKEADMYSFGMFLYELVTGGRRPFEDLRFRSELDAAVVQGRMVDPITDSGSPPWPDVADMIEHLLEHRPDMRPTAVEVYERLYAAELLCLKRDVAVCKGQTVECMAIRNFTENNEPKMEVWIGSGLSNDFGQISWLNLTDRDSDGCQGTVVKDRRVKCITAIHSKLVLAGTQSGTIWVFDALRHTCLHALSILPDAVVCLRHHANNKCDQDVVMAGLANGQLAVYQTKDLLQDSAVPLLVSLCSQHQDGGQCKDCTLHPVACLTVARRRVYCGCGNDVVIIHLDKGFEVERRWSVDDRVKGLVLNIAVGSFVWTSTKDCAQVDFWDTSKAIKRGTVNCKAIIEGSGYQGDSHDMRVVCMLLHGRAALWLGLGTGHVIVLSPCTRDPLYIIHRHVSTVRCMALARGPAFGRPVSLILTGGMGFVERPSCKWKKDNTEFGYMLIWEAELGEQAKLLLADRKKREECLALYGNSC